MPSTHHKDALLISETTKQAIYWLPSSEDSAFRSNAYLVVSGGEALLHDPGGAPFFPRIRAMVDEIVGMEALKALAFSHQDPDVTGSLPLWLGELPELQILTSPRTHILLEEFVVESYARVDSVQGSRFNFGDGASLLCVEAPFLHSPASVVYLDEVEGNLFSGDIWGAVDIDRKHVVEDLTSHVGALDIFHLDYMASSIACRGFCRRLEGLKIERICPQHGAILQGPAVPAALEYLQQLMPGLDLIYPDLV